MFRKGTIFYLQIKNSTYHIDQIKILSKKSGHLQRDPLKSINQIYLTTKSLKNQLSRR